MTAPHLPAADASDQADKARPRKRGMRLQTCVCETLTRMDGCIVRIKKKTTWHVSVALRTAVQKFKEGS